MQFKTNHEPQILAQSYPPQIDARIYAFSKFVSDKGHAPLLMSASAEGKVDGSKVSFAIPSHAAICLHLANQGHIKSNSLILTDLLLKSKDTIQVKSDKIGNLYNFFEQRFLNIVFSYTALEAYSNQIIPDDYEFTRLRQDKKCTESFDKIQIERNVSLDTKLSHVLPEITGKTFPKGSSIWNEYSKLKEIRDRIIHVKSIDLGIKELKAKSIWADLLDHKSIDYSIVAHKIIKHFQIKHDPSSSPVAKGRDLWINTFPFNRPK